MPNAQSLITEANLSKCLIMKTNIFFNWKNIVSSNKKEISIYSKINSNFKAVYKQRTITVYARYLIIYLHPILLEIKQTFITATYNSNIKLPSI